MAKNEKKKNNWRDKLRFSVYNDKTIEELWRIRVTQYNAFLLITSIILFIIGATVSLISFTNLREFIPGYPNVTMRRNILMNAIRLDSLENEIALKDRYFANMNSIISGNAPVDRYSTQDTTKPYSNIEFKSSPEEISLRNQIDQETKYNVTLETRPIENGTSLANIHFYPPVQGSVSGKYDVRIKHYGTDIVTKPKAVVSAALNGTVIFTSWTMETGYVIEIQHTNNLITVYKHNESLLKETGDQVKAGEAISIVGDSGEMYTSGPHLHFEIWYKGNAIDPEKHILF
jgi:murein DD-endopeptidase MepM/ murein hydrolase activator NlpD